MLRTLLRRWSKTSSCSDQAVTTPEPLRQPAPQPGQSSAGRSSVRAPRLAVEVCDLADEVVVRLKGEAGFLEAELFDAALLPLNARRPRLVTFELGELSLISSLVLGILVRFRRNADRTGGRVRLTTLQSEVREAIERTGLTTLLLEQNDSATAQDSARELTLVHS
jgi:anti-anti-sigma factor